MSQPAGRQPVPAATVVPGIGDERGFAIEDAEGEVTSLDELRTQCHSWTNELDENTLEGGV